MFLGRILCDTHPLCGEKNGRHKVSLEPKAGNVESLCQQCGVVTLPSSLAPLRSSTSVVASRWALRTTGQ